MPTTYAKMEQENSSLRADIAAKDAEIAKLTRERERADHDSMTQTRRAIGLEEELVLVRGDLSRVLSSVDRAEARVRELEEKIVRWVMAEETLDHYCNGPDEGCDDEPGVEADLADEVDIAKSDLDSEARAILANRKKEESK